ncbi:hypothetical protein NQ176_g8993 [Zarea fungicola]|uniref:Uncharacterized protein n=1 Tax=Zarea fungicola TaxID=93591 RepID=A0ACC1MQE4_9HYPO|nr:hypothetical protein NQ176_g8993 [Lecanicillium fungicola]
MAGLSPQITNLIIILGMMQVSKRIPFEDPNVLNTVRAVYVGSNVVIGLIYLYIMAQINKKKGTSLRETCAGLAPPHATT